MEPDWEVGPSPSRPHTAKGDELLCILSARYACAFNVVRAKPSSKTVA